MQPPPFLKAGDCLARELLIVLRLFLPLIMIAPFFLLPSSAAEETARKNVLFLMSDDMRPELSVYGHAYMHTPNLQALSDDGYYFHRMYVQQALCAPSRTVILTGRRPDTSHVWTIGPYFRDVYGKNYTTLPQYFKQHGYTSAGSGKIFHSTSRSVIAHIFVRRR